jgi:hypothetical protein
VVLTDLPQMLPLLRRNVEAQFGAVGWEHGAPEVRALPWGSDSLDTCLAGLPVRYGLYTLCIPCLIPIHCQVRPLYTMYPLSNPYTLAGTASIHYVSPV